MRSIFVDGSAIGRINDVVTSVEPLDDGRNAWVLAYWRTYGPMWRVYCWALDDGALLDLEADSGNGLGIAPRAGRVFYSTGSDVDWRDLTTGDEGSFPIDHEEYAGCSRDGRFVASRRRGDLRQYWVRVHRVTGTGAPLPPMREPVVFSDDSRFALHFDEPKALLLRTSLDEGTTVAIAESAGWYGICPVRGAPRAIAWDETRVLVVDLERGAAITERARGALRAIDDAAGTVIATRGALLDLASGRTTELRARTRLTLDGTRALVGDGPALDVLDIATGTLAYTRSGHSTVARHLAWAPGDRALASAADDGSIRVAPMERDTSARPDGGAGPRTHGPDATPRADEPARSGAHDRPRRDGDASRQHAPGGAAITTLRAHVHARPALDGRRVWAVSTGAIEGFDVASATRVSAYPSFGKHIHGVALSPDRRRLAAVSYMSGVLVVDLATGAAVIRESDATKTCTLVAYARAHLVACARERLADHGVAEPAELVHWVRLDERGAVHDRGTWRFPIDRTSSIELLLGGERAFVATYDPRHQLQILDLGDPTRPAHVVELPAGAVLLDGRGERALFREADDVVVRETATGGELARVRCLRRPFAGALAHDGTRIAIAYADGGVEVFA